MTEYVQVPVSLIERAWWVAKRHTNDATLAAGLRALLSQPTPTAEPMGSLDAKLDALGLRDADEPARPDSLPFPHAKADRILAGPHRIDDLAPGTTFTEEVRWTVTGTLSTGITVAHSSAGEMRFADRFDPSTIRDVTPPKDAP